MNLEVVWDGTSNGGRPRYLAVHEPREAKPWPRTPVRRIVDPGTGGRAPVAPRDPSPKPQVLSPTPAAPETVKCLKRKADADVEPLKLQVYRLLLQRDAAIADIVAHFKSTHCKSKVYSAVAALRTSGHAIVLRREVRERARGAGPMMRDVYGPATGRGEL